MNRTKTMLSLLVVCFGLALAGCGSKLSGTYHQTAGGAITLEFKSGKVYSSVLGQTNEGTYEVKGDQVILHLKGEGDVTLKLNSDGTLDTPLGTFAKKSS
jgi:hypothetical protein